jgi:hypothetical protein
MPLTATPTHASLRDDNHAIGVWMLNKHGSKVRVFVTCEALWGTEPSKIRELDSALDIFGAGRERFEQLASDVYDDCTSDDNNDRQGQMVIVLDEEDFPHQL